jgi:hypothetical protein
MSALLKVVDEHFGQPSRRFAMELRLVSERSSARDLIARRVADEVASLNEKRRDHAEGHARTRSFLIAVDEKGPEGLLDEKAELERALAAFERRRFIMLLDDRQLDDLDSPVTLTPGGEVVFIYLMPLAGG